MNRGTILLAFALGLVGGCLATDKASLVGCTVHGGHMAKSVALPVYDDAGAVVSSVSIAVQSYCAFGDEWRSSIVHNDGKAPS